METVSGKDDDMKQRLIPFTKNPREDRFVMNAGNGKYFVDNPRELEQIHDGDITHSDPFTILWMDDKTLIQDSLCIQDVGYNNWVLVSSASNASMWFYMQVSEFLKVCRIADIHEGRISEMHYRFAWRGTRPALIIDRDYHDIRP